MNIELEKCWVCKKPAVWTVTAIKLGTKTVHIQFSACDACIPFALPAAGQKKEPQMETESRSA